MKFSQYLAVAGILSILEYGCAILIKLPECSYTPGYVYIMQQSYNGEVKNVGMYSVITGSSGAPPYDTIFGDIAGISFTEVARFPVNDCINSLNRVTSAVTFEFLGLFNGNLGNDHDQSSFYVQNHQFQAFLNGIAASLHHWIQLRIPPTHWLSPCNEHSQGYANIFFMSLTKKHDPKGTSYVCIRLFESSNIGQDPAPLLSRTLLPHWTITNTIFFPLKVDDCFNVADRVNSVFSKEYPDGYWTNATLYGQSNIMCHTKSGDEDYLHFIKAVEKAAAIPRVVEHGKLVH